MRTSGWIPLSRACEAIEIPDGRKVALPAGTMVMITQALGGTYTVMTDRRYLARIAGKDADAIGLEPQTASQAEAPPAAEGPVDVEKLIWAQLRTIFDPEIPVSVVELGLVYACRITTLPEGGNQVDVVMTLTAPGCGMGDVLKAEAESKMLTVPGVKQTHVEIVVEPPWNPSMMSEAAKLELGFM